MNLSTLKKGEEGIIISFNLPAKWQKKVQELGLKYGTVIKIIRIFRHNGPIEVKAMNVLIGLRKNLAEKIEVKKYEY